MVTGEAEEWRRAPGQWRREGRTSPIGHLTVNYSFDDFTMA